MEMPTFSCIDDVIIPACKLWFFHDTGSVCIVELRIHKSTYADTVWKELFYIYSAIAGRGSQVKFIYKVLLTNKVYLQVLHISAKDTNKMQIKSG